MFFRIKKVKGKEYGYIVENEWKRKGSRQKVKDYIGRVYKFDLKNEIDFQQFLKIDNIDDYIKNNEKNKIIKDLVEWELSKHNIDKEEFSIDLNNVQIQKNKRDVALLINDGFMCNFTLKNLLEFKSEDDEQIDGYRLARAFVEAGIKVPQEVFVDVFGKIHKT